MLCRLVTLGSRGSRRKANVQFLMGKAPRHGLPLRNYSSLTCRPSHALGLAQWNQTLVFRHSLSTTTHLSRRAIAELEDRLSSSIGDLQDPVLGQDLASLQWFHRRLAISDDGTLLVLLKLPSLLYPSLDELKNLVKQETEKVVAQWLSETGRDGNLLKAVKVEVMATTPLPMMARLVEDHNELLDRLGPGLANISHFVAVYSCKGGVGKSTVSVNLAYELARAGGRVGLLDLDIYGPSLPILVEPDDPTVRRSPAGPGLVYPINHRGVKLLSLGFVSKKSGVPGSGQDNGAAVMRGPMAGKVVTQLLKGTDWGELDVLILDLPPGTGDVQLAVLQDLQLSGAVAVTTPSKLALSDTRKGIDMFTSLGVPTIAVVENMAYFECEGGSKHYPFGRGLVEQSDTGYAALVDDVSTLQMPVSTITNESNDAGQPLCLARPDSAAHELSAYSSLSEVVSTELLKLQYDTRDSQKLVMFGDSEESFDLATLTLSLDKIRGDSFTVRVYSNSGATQKRVSPSNLRGRDPKSGDIMPGNPYSEEEDESPTLRPEVSVHKAKGKKLPSLVPTKVERRGRYGFAVDWADGATIIYSTLSIAKAAGANPTV